jgi:hypothetical protein
MARLTSAPASITIVHLSRAISFARKPALLDRRNITPFLAGYLVFDKNASAASS